MGCGASTEEKSWNSMTSEEKIKKINKERASYENDPYALSMYDLHMKVYSKWS